MSRLTPVLPLGPVAGRGIELWWDAVRTDRRLRVEQLLTAKALAELADRDGCVQVTVRSLADAVGRKDAANRTKATVERGLDGLTLRGYVVRLNPGAPRSEKGHYRLTVPTGALEVLVSGLVSAENAA